MKNSTNIISLKNASKNYYTKNGKIEILKNVNLNLESGNFYAFMGQSGCGKTTLINILGLLDKIEDGEYFLYNKNVNKENDKELSFLRMSNIGFIFQEFNLNPNLKAYENVIIPMLINDKIDKKTRKEKAISLLKKVGLENRINHFPKELSGGEQQRVAIARALANNPNIILADEPTGNLDEKNENKIFNILKDLSEHGKCIIVVSHSNNVKKYADKIFNIKNSNIKDQDEK